MIKYCAPSELYNTAVGSIKPTLKVLDIGSGIHPSIELHAPTHICCEPYKEYVDILKARYPHLIVENKSWAETVDYFEVKSVDTVLLIDVIEHLEKEEGLRLLPKTLELAKQQVVIFTPLGFFEQTHPDGMDAWGYHGGEWQTHRSGWEPEDFKEVEGGTWDFYVCPNYHVHDNKGQVLNPPKGALWAIWTRN